MSKKHKCEQCGSCCVHLTLGVLIEESDIRRWVREQRADILQYCNGWNDSSFKFLLQEEENEVVSYFMRPANRDMWIDHGVSEIHLCPFLRKKRGKNQFECLIQDTKPMRCQKYFCNPKHILKIVKKPFETNLKEYKKKRRKYHSVTSSPYKMEYLVHHIK